MKSFSELRQDVPRSELSEADIAAMVRRSKKAARRMKILAKKSSTKFKRALAKKKVQNKTGQQWIAMELQKKKR